MGVQEQSYNKKVRFWDKFHGTRGARGRKWPGFELFSLQKWLFSTFYYCIFTLKSVDIEILSPMCTKAPPTSKLLIYWLIMTPRYHWGRYWHAMLDKTYYSGMVPQIRELCVPHPSRQARGRAEQNFMPVQSSLPERPPREMRWSIALQHSWKVAWQLVREPQVADDLHCNCTPSKCFHNNKLSAWARRITVMK